MKPAIDKAIALLERVRTSSDPDGEALALSESLLDAVQAVQTKYVDIIATSLKLLVQDKQTESHDSLQQNRLALEPCKESIAGLSVFFAQRDQAFIKLVIEYLYTRTRLVDELKLFPSLGIELLERMTFDESLEETINFLEEAMTGKRKLIEKIVDVYQDQSINR